MKMKFFAALAVFMILTLTGCGSDHNHPPPEYVTTSIFSDARFDGDIRQDIFGFTVTQGTTPSVFAGLDPFSDAEYRAFLDFPLSGVNGVPGDAIIESAFLDIYIDDIVTGFLSATIPLRIDLVSFQPPFLLGTDFNRPALATILVRPPISLTDLGKPITIDVTTLMIEAQSLGHLDFQIRLMEDLGNVIPGLIEINETNRPPLLIVTYF